MCSFYRPASTRYMLLAIVLMAAAANASVLECNKTLQVNQAFTAKCKSVEQIAGATSVNTLKGAIPAVTPTAIVAGGGFPLNQTRASDAATGSAPLLVLISALVGVILIRAKSYNSK